MPRTHIRRGRRLAAVGVVAALAVSLAGVSTGSASAKNSRPAAKTGPVKVQLLSFNDYHGHLERDTPGEVERTLADGTVEEITAGGAEFLARHLRQLRRGHANSLTVTAGDLIGGSPFLSGLFHDEPSVESLNAMGLDLSGVGNHEFDEGVKELRRMQRGGCHPVDGCYFPEQPYAGADFRWLAANVKNDETGKSALRPYAIRRVDGERIAFIGMTLEGTDQLVAQAGIRGWSFRDEVRTANQLVPKIRALGVEAIVVLLHEGGYQEGNVNQCEGISGPVVDIAERLKPAIDMVVTGHTHQAYNCTVKDPNGRPRKVTSAASYGRVVTETNLEINRRTGDVIRRSVKSRNHIVTQDVEPVLALSQILSKWSALADEVGNEPIGKVTEDITRAFEPDGSDNRGAESGASNLIADAQLAATEVNGAQIAFMNPGGVRDDFDYAPDGVITYAEAFNVQPFGNLLVTMPMTGAQIQTLLEQQCNTERQFQLGVSEGFTYTDERTVDPANSRSCTDITVSDMKLDGVAIDMDTTYMVTVNSFLADGGDGFSVLAEIPANERIGGGGDLDALIAYFAANSPVSDPGTDRVTEVR
jgi:5'-nucleotidase